MTNAADLAFLSHALRLAERGLGRTAPNPTVGCVIVKDGRIIGAARTGDGGRPHAETLALKMAGDSARGATAYVTLEPCAHHGKTPPCAEALIRAGVARVVIGCADPDPRTHGKGIAMLEAAGIEVSLLTTHHSPLTDMNRGFFRRIQHGLPYVALKLATSQDFFMARNDGATQWLTGEFARQHGHRIRAAHDAILTGIGTVLADDPLLTVRPPIAPHPNLVRIVADRNLRLKLTSKLVKSAQQFPLLLITTPEGVEQNASHATELRERGIKVIALENPSASAREALPRRGRVGVGAELSNTVPKSSPPPNLPPPGGGVASHVSLRETFDAGRVRSMLEALATEGLTRVLIEAGPKLSAAFLSSGLAQTLHWYRAAVALGNAGAAPINTLEASAAGATREESRRLGEDIYERYELPEATHE